MNIAFFNWYAIDLLFSGIEKVSHRVATALEERGHHLCYVCVDSWGKTALQKNTIILPNASKIEAEENRIALRDFLRSHDVSVLVSHSAYSRRLAGMLREATYEAGAKLVQVLHTTPDSYHYRYWQCKVVNRAVRAFMNRKWGNSWSKIYSLSDAFVVLCQPSAEFITRIAHIQDPSKFAVIHNANTYLPTELAPAYDKEPIVLYVGRLVKGKGIEHIPTIWRQVSAQHPDWRLIVLGDGPYRATLEKAQLANCDILGTQEPKPYYERAAISILTSNAEGWSMVLTEAMQYGVVPVAFDSFLATGVVLDEGRAGVLVPPFDLNLFAQEVSSLIADSDRRTAMAEHARRYVQAFDIDHIIADWERLFERLS
ncbi:glycosyltransferase [uncultured Porphyromonas sp.]|uniref:glycosyltransferase n=1 Tax=uncultured Porphyromonas sp. TaxID=159274 RepID=UPI0028054DF0|nr:glycosyltransferase [uncultured Porphyromonas sp.]